MAKQPEVSQQAWPSFRSHLPGFVPWFLTPPDWTQAFRPVAKWETHKEEPMFNELLLEQIKKSGLPHTEGWVGDCILLPRAVEEGERPYFPYAFMLLSEEGLVLNMKLFKPDEVSQDLPNALMEMFQDLQCLPESLLVGSEKAFVLLEPIAEKLDIEIPQVVSHPMLESFLNSLGDYMGGNG